MAWESLLKALPNWGKDIREDNIPDEPDFYLEEQDREMTQGEIKSSYRQLENMIEIMRNCLLTDKQAEAKLDTKALRHRRGWKEVLEEKKWGNKKVKEIIASLETIRDKIQDPIPSGIGDLKLRGSKLSD